MNIPSRTLKDIEEGRIRMETLLKALVPVEPFEKSIRDDCLDPDPADLEEAREALVTGKETIRDNMTEQLVEQPGFMSELITGIDQALANIGEPPPEEFIQEEIAHARTQFFWQWVNMMQSSADLAGPDGCVLDERFIPKVLPRMWKYIRREQVFRTDKEWDAVVDEFVARAHASLPLVFPDDYTVERMPDGRLLARSPEKRRPAKPANPATVARVAADLEKGEPFDDNE